MPPHLSWRPVRGAGAEDLAELALQDGLDRRVGLVALSGQEAALVVHRHVDLRQLDLPHGLVVEAPHGPGTPPHRLEGLEELRDRPAGQLGGLRRQGDPQRGLVVAAGDQDVLDDQR